MDMVERVARAIEAAMDAGSPTGWAGEFDVADLARATIAAMTAPTDAMTKGADGYVMYCKENEVLPTAGGVYRAMIDAALTSSEKP